MVQSLLENIPLPAIVVDSDLRIRYTNSGYRTLSGLTAQELDGRLLSDVTAWEPPGIPENNFDLEQKAGTVAYRVRGRLLAPGHRLITFEDITDRKQTEGLRMLVQNLFECQEDERRRIARELHDDVSQQLASLDIDSDEVERKLTSSPDEALERLKRVRSGLAALSESVRTLSNHLHPSILEDLGLVASLRALTNDVNRNEEVVATFSQKDVPEGVPVETAIVLYRVAQEALGNVVEHAGESEVKVQLHGFPGTVQLEVSDTGRGFNLSDGHSGLGLMAMAERARIAGGSLQITSSPGQGTRVLIQVPLNGSSC